MAMNDRTGSFNLTRRTTLAALAGSSVLALVPWRAHANGAGQSALFQHGVASGDPDATSVVLWTRITAEGAQQVRWQLAADASFADVLQQGAVTTGADQDHTIKVLAQGLKPGGVYYYRFLSDGGISPIGRARTLPQGRLDRLGIALASCSNYAFGYFNAYDAIASDAHVDFVLHTGDYIYEYGGEEGWGNEVATRLGRVHEPRHEIVSLADYRQRHAQYKTDAGSRAMHAAHSLLACWDDHESANNPWTGGAQNHQPDKEGEWQARRDASIRAYFEWMPVREPEWLEAKGRNRMQFWRSYSFGDLAMLHTLETRHTGRARQIDYREYADKITSNADSQRLVDDVFGAPGRAMLSAELEADLGSALRASVAEGQPWRLIGNPMPIARTTVPDVVKLGLLPDPAADDAASDAAKALAWKGKWNLPFYPDTWDGYGWARERLYDLSREAGAGDLVFLTGDSHSFWANTLADGSGRPAGVELGTAGITSPGDFVGSGFGAELSEKLDRAFEVHNDEVVWTDNMHQGYVRLEMQRDRADASFIAVDTLRSLDYRTSVLRRFTLARKAEAMQFLG